MLALLNRQIVHCTMHYPVTGTQIAKHFEIICKAANCHCSRFQGSEPQRLDATHCYHPCSHDFYHINDNCHFLSLGSCLYSCLHSCLHSCSCSCDQSCQDDPNWWCSSLSWGLQVLQSIHVMTTLPMTSYHLQKILQVLQSNKPANDRLASPQDSLSVTKCTCKVAPVINKTPSLFFVSQQLKFKQTQLFNHKQNSNEHYYHSANSNLGKEGHFNAEHPPAILMSKHVAHFYCCKIGDLKYEANKHKLNNQDTDWLNFLKGICTLYDHDSKFNDPNIFDINKYKKYQFNDIHNSNQSCYVWNIWYAKCSKTAHKSSQNVVYIHSIGVIKNLPLLMWQNQSNYSQSK